MKLILHIGQSKTGTTALQSMLKRNRNVLKEHGILYPDNFLKGVSLDTLNQNAFANAINGYDFYKHLSADQYWEQFSEQFSTGDFKCMLLSGESFFGGRPHIWETDDYYRDYKEKLLKLKSYIDQGSWEVEIIIYLRSQNEWLESAIPHIIRYEGTLKGHIYKNDEQLAEDLKPVINYNHMIKLWDEVLSPKKIQLCEYDRNIFPNNNVVEDFLQRINLSDARLSTVNSLDNAHDSWSRELIEVKKTLNLKSKSRMQEEAIIDIINSLNDRLENRKKYTLSPELHRKVRVAFEKGNRELSKTYNENKPIFSSERIKKLETREYSSFPQEALEVEILNYQAYSRSFTGRRIHIRSCIKRILRKKAPLVYVFCSKCVKKIKRRRS